MQRRSRVKCTAVVSPSPVGLAIVTGYPRDPAGKATGDFQIQMTNASGHAPLNVILTDRSYQAPPIQTALSPAESVQTTISTRSSAGWYDVAITSDALPGLECRFAGHVETGRWSSTDPAMGEA